MSTLIPAPDNIVRACERSRRDILVNNSDISNHAEDRMVQRDIKLPQVLECVRNGSRSTATPKVDLPVRRKMHSKTYETYRVLKEQLGEWVNRDAINKGALTQLKEYHGAKIEIFFHWWTGKPGRPEVMMYLDPNWKLTGCGRIESVRLLEDCERVYANPVTAARVATKQYFTPAARKEVGRRTKELFRDPVYRTKWMNARQPGAQRQTAESNEKRRRTSKQLWRSPIFRLRQQLGALRNRIEKQRRALDRAYSMLGRQSGNLIKERRIEQGTLPTHWSS